MARILVLGATGYVGGRLIPRLLEDGHEVSCLVRDRRRIMGKSWSNQIDLYTGDVLDSDSLRESFSHTDIVYYLVHSMGKHDKDFEELDRRGAHNTGQVARETVVKRIIYLGGLGQTGGDQSRHLRSRHEVAEILQSYQIPVTVFRAAVIVGSGSISFELIHHLVNRLPVMICPRWIYSRTQPIGIADVISYLRMAVKEPQSAGKTIDIGGPDVISYGDMMKTVARVLGLRRYLVPVPVLTPRLSSYWVNLVTPIPSAIAGALIEGLRHDTVCDNTLASSLFTITPMPFETAVQRALQSITTRAVETAWTGAGGHRGSIDIDRSHLLRDLRTITVAASAEKVFGEVRSIGGENGWYYADWLWKLRGFIDKQIGGVGLRRGRRHPERISVGEALDFWRVEDYIENRRLRLKAEMKVGGHAWLDFEVEPLDENESRLVQTAEFYPRGLVGLLYWFSVYPIHTLVFKGLIRAVAARAVSHKI